MANLHVPVLHDRTGEPTTRARMRAASLLLREVTYRLVAAHARLRSAQGDERRLLCAELVELENDWRCLAAVQAYTRDVSPAE